MTDYKNELRSVLYDFLGDYKDKRYLSEGNTDRALADIEALLSERELEARVTQAKRLDLYIAPEFRELYEQEVDQLTNREEK